MTNIIYQYKRDKKGNLIGCVCAKKLDSATFSVGWSKLNKKDQRGDKQSALRIAELRAEGGEVKETSEINVGGGKVIYEKVYVSSVPSVLKEEFLDLIGRGSRYFRGCSYVGDIY